MFPTFSSLVNYLFGTDLSWPVPTFGIFVTLAFILSYLTFWSEFARKERLLQFSTFKCKVRWGTRMKLMLFLGYGCIGFLIGYKGVGALIEQETFSYNPVRFIFSTQGDWTAGLLICLSFCIMTTFIYRSLLFSQTFTQMRSARPREILPTMLLWAGVSGFVGAKVFNIFENGHLYHSHSYFEILDFGGLTFWGGLIFGALSYLIIGRKNGMRWQHLADVGSLGMLVAYGVGRIGCHLSGDGDWGVVNNADKPFTWLPDWMWSFRFPHNVLEQGEYIPECVGKYCYILPQGVFPTSFYESVIILFAFAVLWMVKDKIKMPGLLFAIYLFIAGMERFLIEFIRVNYKFDVFGFSLSEAQLVGVFMIILSFIVTGCLLLKHNRTGVCSEAVTAENAKRRSRVIGDVGAERAR
ncbi:diacylglyceryl transferase [Sphingobacterium shayense]|uniref:prolipoprotein diacylglyceryl transferase n=1 Tax=Sphingobacterium shayense TaxID=626343 RepID=UPI0015556C0A|nr:prolipoprotein diacylglyceryl transferase family protein [Sphingobacterium shayense]NQD71706.1 diacylglyceryl transferase [Sphingobacterium shayense]